MQSRRYLVEGRVQGVFFRAGVKAEAMRLGLRGYARNLPDGRVEVLAAGEQPALWALAQWLQRGTPQAQVTAVTEAPGDASVPLGFEIR